MVQRKWTDDVEKDPPGPSDLDDVKNVMEYKRREKLPRKGQNGEFKYLQVIMTTNWRRRKNIITSKFTDTSVYVKISDAYDYLRRYTSNSLFIQTKLFLLRIALTL